MAFKGKSELYFPHLEALVRRPLVSLVESAAHHHHGRGGVLEGGDPHGGDAQGVGHVGAGSPAAVLKDVDVAVGLIGEVYCNYLSSCPYAFLCSNGR